MKIETLLSKDVPLLAHIGRSTDETLTEHSELALDFCKKLIEENGLGEAVSRTIQAVTFAGEELSAQEQRLIEKWFYQAIYLHDLGKVNPAFQKAKMKNSSVTVEGDLTTQHSLLSSLLYLEIHEKDLPPVEEDPEKLMFLSYILYIFSYIISRHHSYLEDFSLDTYSDKLTALAKKINRMPKYLEYYENKSSFFHDFNLEEFTEEGYLDSESHSHFPFYILTRLLYSALVASDFYATYTYDKEGKKPAFRYLKKEDVKKLRDIYNETDIVKGIKAYKQNPAHFIKNPINKLRSDMYLEAERELVKSHSKSLFYLEAPTGSGKTNMSINLGLSLLEQEESLNKILYIFPFNTLVEQTKKFFDGIFPEDVQNHYPISVINSVTPIVQSYEKNEREYVDLSEKTGKAFYDYKEEVLYRQMLQYPILLTSHVNFFNYLFGTGREANLAFVHLCNSVIIIDEIQSYKNARWMEIMEFFSHFAELLNIKIIIMSATLPKLDRLLKEGQKTVELLPNAKNYFANPLFKKRVHIHFDLLDEGKITIERLVEKVLEIRRKFAKRRILVECIKRKDAETVYQLLQEQAGNELPIALLTGSNHAYYRKQVIDQLGKNEDGTMKLDEIILVATQVIEAGVDIDMDLGLKDISTLDSEEQFLGRINRSCLRDDCHAYFFHMSDAEDVYRGDYRLEFDLRHRDYQTYLENKQFEKFYEHVFAELKRTKSELNEKNIENFYKRVQALQYGKVAEHMRLIEEQKYQLFLAHQMEIDGTELDGKLVWKEFEALNKDRSMDYSRRRVALSMLAEKMSYFIYSIYQKPKIDNEQIGNLYYVENGELFLMKDAFTGLMVFDEKKMKEQSEEMFL